MRDQTIKNMAVSAHTYIWDQTIQNVAVNDTYIYIYKSMAESIQKGVITIHWAFKHGTQTVSTWNVSNQYNQKPS